jgi:hypothetical protein
VHGVRGGAYRDLVGKPEGKRPVGRPRRIWNNSMGSDIYKIGWRRC